MRPTGSVTDDEIVNAVIVCRAREGACSYRSLGARVGLSTTAVKYRVGRLIAAGRLMASPQAGSIRPSPGPLGQLVITHNVVVNQSGQITMEIESVRHIGLPIPLSTLAQSAGREDQWPRGAAPDPGLGFEAD